MPFTFKPEISQDQAAPAQPAPAASFGAQSSQTIANRTFKEGKSLVEMILFAAFVGSLVLAVGLVIYKYYLSSQIETKKAQLQQYEDNLGQLPLEDMRRLSNRIKVINQLVKEHPSVNTALAIVENSVENQVTYKGFELRYNEQGKNYLLVLRGLSPDYRSLAQQVDTLKRKPYSNYIPNVTVDSVLPDGYGKINFTLKMPIQIAGLLPESLNLSDGAASRIASSTQMMQMQGTQNATSTASSSAPVTQTASSTVRTATTTQPGLVAPKR